MEEEMLLKGAYRRLYKDVLLIKKQVEDLDMNLEETNRFIKECLLIDGKVLKEEEFQNVRKEMATVEKELTNEILPIIRRSC